MPNSSNVTEIIDERILRLLGLKDVFDLDYDTYRLLIKEVLVKISLGKLRIPDVERDLLKDELKKYRSSGKEGRFKIKEKKISTQSFGAANFSTQTKKIKREKLLPQYQPQQLRLPPGKADNKAESSIGSYLSDISKSLANIIKILNASIKLDKKTDESGRKTREKSAREKEETNLEKGFRLVKKTLSKVLTPVKNILSSIIDFLMKMFLARATYKLLEWMADPQNKDKLRSIFRFLGDHWPKLLSLYIMFGTSLGKFARGLIAVVVRGAAMLAKAAAQLLAKAGLKGAGKFAQLFGGKYAKLITLGIETAATIGTTVAIDKGLEGFQGLDAENKDNQQKANASKQDSSKKPGYFGGGLASLKRLFGFAGGSFINFPGLVSGQKGVDKIPAMLSDGEFVMSKGAVQKYGVDTLEAMNAAGGGTNRPKMIQGTTFAVGGGLIGGSGSGRPEYIAQYDRTHGAGSYAKELARRRAITDAQDNVDIALRRNLQRGQIPPSQRSSTQRSASGNRKITVNGIKITAPIDADIRKAWNRAFSDPNNPLHDKAAFDDSYNYAQFKKDYLANLAKQAKSSSATPSSQASGARRKFSPASIVRQDAFRGSFQPGGLFGGPRMKARTDYAASKGKYYSSSDQKTYGNYNDAKAAKQSRMTSLASQQRLDKLSNQIVGRGGRRRSTAENVARYSEDAKRGGDWGKLGRVFTSMFGTGAQIAKNSAADKASEARVKQAGAASIGRYYSSSDGKYYKDYNAAVLAKKQRQKSGVSPLNPKPAVVKTSQNKPTRRSNSGGGHSSTPNVPRIPASHPSGTRATEATLGVRR